MKEIIQEELRSKERYLIVCPEEDSFYLKIAFHLVEKLRNKGVEVERSVDLKSKEEILNYSGQKGIKKVIFIGLSKEEVVVVDLSTKKEESLKIIDILSEE
ncbi:hypothetical protein KKB84_07400 [bacterium]|nr:hypothetical protein [bacterium]MBU1153772.1 hypothetical protein [bacterium]MBU2600323.1 hypothetical protein [bacterium]